MSSTLSEGVRVPDIGSTSWGADVNFNWGLLNTALANISDNVKTDVANTWTAPQTFSETISGSIDGIAARAVGDEDGTNIKAALTGKAADNSVVHLAGAETITGDKTFTGAVVTHNITPETDNTYSLGSSTLAWSAVYANTYYYGGTEFSDKFWTADTVQSFTVSKHLRAYNLKVGQGETYGRTGYSLVWTDKNDVPVGYIDSFKNANAARTVLRIQAGDYYTSGTPDSEGTQVIASLRVGTLANSTRVIEAGVDAVYPTTNNATDLGTSSNKWKTLNGINPGMLSFPANSYVDIDTTGWTAGGTNRVQINGADPTYPGWLFVRLSNIAPATDYCLIRLFGTGIGDMSICGAHSDKHIMVFAPVPANTAVRVYCSVLPAYCRYYPCLGNV